MTGAEAEGAEICSRCTSAADAMLRDAAYQGEFRKLALNFPHLPFAKFVDDVKWELATKERAETPDNIRKTARTLVRRAMGRE